MAPPSIAEKVFDDLDTEPNDTMLQATDVTLSGDELHFTGNLTPGDVDTWRIKAKSGTIVDITVTPQNFDVITDFSPIDKEAARRVYDEHSGSEELLTNLRLTPQGGYLTIRGRNTEAAPYTVSIRRILARGDEIIEQEPNEDISTAQPIWTDRELNATLNPSDDVDFFKLNQNKPGILSCDFGQQAVTFRILQNNKTIFQTESVPGETVRTPALQASSDLYVRLESLTPSQNPERYRCRLTALDTIPNEMEPNDIPETAQKLSDTADDIEFSFMSASDVDVFRVTTPPNEARRYNARIEAPEDVSATLNVLSGKGAPLQQPTGARACLFSVAPGQDFLLRVAHAPTNKTYPLNYRLRMSSLPADQTESEPNNATTQATPIEPGKPLSGFIFPEADIDYYRVEIPASDSSKGGKLEVSTSAGYISPLKIHLEDAAGYEITRAESAQVSRPIHLSFDAPAGTYYIVVSGQSDQCLKPYTLNVTYTPTPAEPAEPEAASEPPQADAVPPAEIPAHEEAPAAPPAAFSVTDPPAPAPENKPNDAPTQTAEDEVNIDLLLQAAGSATGAKPAPAKDAAQPADAPSPKPNEDDEDAF